jgi:hypothetical protein
VYLRKINALKTKIAKLAKIGIRPDNIYDAFIASNPRNRSVDIRLDDRAKKCNVILSQGKESLFAVSGGAAVNQTPPPLPLAWLGSGNPFFTPMQFRILKRFRKR